MQDEEGWPHISLEENLLTRFMIDEQGLMKLPYLNMEPLLNTAAAFVKDHSVVNQTDVGLQFYLIISVTAHFLQGERLVTSSLFLLLVDELFAGRISKFKTFDPAAVDAILNFAASNGTSVNPLSTRNSSLEDCSLESTKERMDKCDAEARPCMLDLICPSLSD